MKKPLLLGCAFLLNLTALALARAADPAAAPQDMARSKLDRVQLSGSSSSEAANELVGLNQVVGRKEFEKFGDSQVVDALRRLPGLSIEVNKGRQTQVRLRGMGEGYLRITINGEAVPPGFTLDGLSTAQVERIEVNRTGRADTSGQAVGGTINIVLRNAGSAAERTVQVNAAVVEQMPGMQVDLQWGDKSSGVRTNTTASVQREFTAWHSGLVIRNVAPSGALLGQQQANQDNRGTATTATLGSGMNGKSGDATTWLLDGLLRYKTTSDYTDELRNFEGTGVTPSLLRDHTDASLTTASGQFRANGKHRFDGGLSADATVAFNAHRRKTKTDLWDDDEAPLSKLVRTVGSTAKTRATTVKGKLSQPFGDAWRLEYGGELEDAWRYEDRAQEELTSTPFFAYTAKVRREAAYAQADWNPTERSSGYLGLRWEGITTNTSGNDLELVRQRHGILSPIARWGMDIDAKGDKSISASVARSYKMPNPRDLIPQRWLSTSNSQFDPDQGGNPALRPETAWGIDLSYQQKLGPAGKISLNAYQRYIDNVILRHLAIEGGRWVETKANAGRARLSGVEADARLAARSVFPRAPNLTVNAYVGAGSSRLLDVAEGSRNSEQRLPVTVRVGWEHIVDPKFRWGSQLQYQGRKEFRRAATQSQATDAFDSADFYFSYSPDKQSNVRLSISNIFGVDRGSLLQDLDDASFSQSTREYRRPSARLIYKRPL